MYSRGYRYGDIFGSVHFSKLDFTPRPPYLPEIRRGRRPQNDFAHQRISLRLSHAPRAAEEEEKHKELIETVDLVRRVQSHNPYTTRSLLINLDQAQHDLEVESKGKWERERYSDQIASYLPMKPVSLANFKRSRRSSYGRLKEDKLFVNRLLKDKGPQSYNWRIAFSELLKYSASERVDKSKDNGSLDHTPSPVQIDGSHLSHIQDLCGNIEDQISIRRVTSRSRDHRSFKLARNISPPTEWSEASVAVYVEALAESQKSQARVPRAGKPRMEGWTNIGDIVTAFDTIFHSTPFQKFLSIEACNTALRFFYDYGMMSKARALYLRMEDLKMRIPTETFNILLRGSASQRDLHNFTFFLKIMIRRGSKPNEVTWILFLQVIESSEVRAVIVGQMAEMNMLDKIGIKRKVVIQMIHHEIVGHLGNGHDHHSFLDHMDSKYGIGWLSTTAGNILLHEVAKCISTVESLSLLYKMKEAGFIPDDISMNTLLRHCLPLGQYDLGIKILDVFKDLYSLHPGPQVYETLFVQAWRDHLLNLSTAIWICACVNEEVSVKLQKRVFQILLSYTPALEERIQSDDPAENSNCSTSAKFEKFAGRSVIGLDGLRGPASSKATDTLGLNSRKRTREWASNLLRTSLRLSGTRRLQTDISQTLGQALKMDNTWAAKKGLYKRDDWLDIFIHAIATHMHTHPLHSQEKLQLSPDVQTCMEH